MPNGPLFLTVTQLAKLTGEHPYTVRKRARNGGYKGAIGGGRKPYRVPISNIERLLGIPRETILQSLNSIPLS